MNHIFLSCLFLPNFF